MISLNDFESGQISDDEFGYWYHFPDPLRNIPLEIVRRHPLHYFQDCASLFEHHETKKWKWNVSCFLTKGRWDYYGAHSAMRCKDEWEARETKGYIFSSAQEALDDMIIFLGDQIKLIEEMTKGFKKDLYG